MGNTKYKVQAVTPAANALSISKIGIVSLLEIKKKTRHGKLTSLYITAMGHGIGEEALDFEEIHRWINFERLE